MNARLMLRLGLFATMPASAQTGQTIRDIVIEGNQRIEVSTIQNYLTLQPGATYSSAEADQSLKALFATGLFSDVNLRLQGNTLIVRVTENPVVNRILLEGNRRIQADQIRKQIHELGYVIEDTKEGIRWKKR